METNLIREIVKDLEANLLSENELMFDGEELDRYVDEVFSAMTEERMRIINKRKELMEVGYDT